MTWGHAVSAPRRALTAIASPAFAATSRVRATSGPALRTETTRRRDDVLRLVSIEIKAADLRRMKPSDPRRGRLHRAIYSARHEILKRGAD